MRSRFFLEIQHNQKRRTRLLVVENDLGTLFLNRIRLNKTSPKKIYTQIHRSIAQQHVSKHT